SSSHDPWTNPWTNSQAAFFGKERNEKRGKLSEPETGSVYFKRRKSRFVGSLSTFVSEQSEVRIIDLILEEAKPGVYVGRERILYFPPYVPPPTGLKASSSAALKGTP
ncbi:hypothetical protein V1478_003029, partial [Vespula squamosa]